MNPKELLQSLTITGRHISSGFRRINPSDLRIDRSRVQAREKLIGQPAAIELKNLRRNRQFSTGPSATQHQHILLTNLAPIAETHGSDLLDDDEEERHQRAYESVDNNPFLFHDSYTSTVYTAPSVRRSGDAIDVEGPDDEDNLPEALSQVRLALQDTNLELDHIIAEFERNSERQNERVSYSSRCYCVCCIPTHFVGCCRDFWRRQRLLSARNFRLLFFLCLAIIGLFVTKWLYDMFRAARYPITEDFQVLKLQQWPLHDIESQNMSFDTTSRERETWNFDKDDSSEEAGHDGMLKNSSNSTKATDVYEVKVGENIVNHSIVIQTYQVAERVLDALNSNSSELETRQWKGIAGAVALRELGQKLNITENLISLEGTLPDNLCYREPNLTCSDTAWFRSIDGKCNNMIHKSWGSTYSPFRRIILRKSPSQESLPSPDYVSEKAHGGIPREDLLASSLLPLWGMFILHDTVKMAQSPINCCDDREATNNISHNGEVFLSICDIMVANPHASHSHANSTKLKDDCSSTTPLSLTNKLSAIYPACKIGHRSSFNLVTPYIDASNIYGSSEEISDKLREKHFGKLVVNNKWKGFLPSANQLNESCYFGNPVNAEIPDCVFAGDQDVNQIAYLTALNTIFLRQHNRIAHLLRGHNSRWNDTRLFQETRRIVIAQIQHITYNEFLPQLLGQKMPFKELALEKEDFYNDYDPEVNPSPSTAFAGAAGLFWYSMIGERVKLTFREEMKGQADTSMNISDLIFSPKSLYPLRHKDALGSLVKGLVSMNANRVGVEFPSQLRTLSLKLTNTSVDLVRMVIEKGRDLEIPPYVEWRKVCGLSEPRTFEDLGRRWYPAARKSLTETYKHVEDVDLFSGMLAEIPIVPGRVGPTLACLLTDQFVRFRKGDRYWYESNAHFHHFTQAQLEEIRGTTLARIICSNLKLKRIQRWPMLIPNRDTNPILSCSDSYLKRQQLDFRHWEESSIGLQVLNPESDDSSGSDSSDEFSSEIDEKGQFRIHAPVTLKANNRDDHPPAVPAQRASSSNAYQKVTPKSLGLPVQVEHRLGVD